VVGFKYECLFVRERMMCGLVLLWVIELSCEALVS
jgi:hypothetical protein